MTLHHHEAIERMQTVLDQCWQSHHIFYGLHRTETLRRCPTLGQPFLASDWATNLYMASQGKIHVTEQGWIQLGTQGMSNTKGFSQSQRQRWLDYVLPLSRLSGVVWRLSRGMPWRKRTRLRWTALILNGVFVRSQLLEAAVGLKRKWQ